MNPIAWLHTLDSLTQLLDQAPASRARALAPVADALRSAGQHYDGIRAQYGSALDDAVAQHHASMARWLLTVLGTNGIWLEVDRAVRHLEREELERRRGQHLHPTVIALSDGRMHVLAPEIATPFSLENAPERSAFCVFRQSLTSIVRVVARVPGVLGSGIEARISDASDGRSFRFNLRVRLGEHLEVFENIDLTRRNRNRRLYASVLLQAPEVLAVGRPENTPWTPLSMGSGDALRALQDRASAARRLHAASSIHQTILDDLFEELYRVMELRPERPSVLITLEPAETSLRRALRDAGDAIAYLRAP